VTTFNLADLFESLVDAFPERLALVSGDLRFTYAELDARANRAAHALAARGVGPGDHVGLYLYNGHEYVEAMIGAFKLRAVPVNINYRYASDDLAQLLGVANLAALVHEADLGHRVQALELPRIAVGGDYEDALAAASPERGFPERSGDDLHIIFTGGTTGLPRGVMWRHEDLLFAGLQGGNAGGPPVETPEGVVAAARKRTSPIAILPSPPFIHGSSQLATWICLLGAGKVVVAPGKSYDPRLIWRLVERERVNTMTVVGDAMIRPLLEALDGQDASSLMVLSSGGAILSASIRDELQAKLPMLIILNSFGASETGHQGNVIPGMGGGFMMDPTNEVLGEDGHPAPPGSLGRLARRGRLPLGYYNDPEKTAATFPTLHGTRWCVPGDLATREPDGRITVHGRGAMCINTGGEKIFPEEVEEALKAHPGVLDAVVVGVPDERWGQRVVAVVQARPGSRVTLPILDEHCRRKIAAYKVPRELRVVDQIVRQPSGKPDYRWAREAAQTPEPA
jgi:acyl-CoA synthetase (AMP-forming)/AMP-acid ligase II